MNALYNFVGETNYQFSEHYKPLQIVLKIRDATLVYW